MTPQEQTVALAEALGWRWYRSGGGKVVFLPEKPANPLFEGPLEFVPSFLKEAAPTGLPPYDHSLDALQVAKRKLLVTHELCEQFQDCLLEHTLHTHKYEHPTDGWITCQPADVQLRALLKTLGIWKS